MKHECSSILFRCMDFRFEPAITDWLKKEGLLGDVDIVSIAGAVKTFLTPKTPAEAEFAMRHVEISQNLHHSKNVVLMNHLDCGAYGGRKAFASDEEEKTKHVADMRAAKDAISAKFPEYTFRLVLAHIDERGTVGFEEITA